MREHVMDVSTEVFRVLRQHAPGCVSLGEEKPGPTQKIPVGEDVYTEFIDRAIAHRQTLDQVIREACTRTKSKIFSGGGPGDNARRLKETRRHRGRQPRRFLVRPTGLTPSLPMVVAFWPTKHKGLAQFVLLTYFGHFGSGRGGCHRQEMVTNRHLLMSRFKPTNAGTNDDAVRYF